MILVTTEQKLSVKTLGADQLSGLPQVIRIWEQWYHVYIKRNSTQALTRGLSNVSFLNYFSAYLKKTEEYVEKIASSNSHLCVVDNVSEFQMLFLVCPDCIQNSWVIVESEQRRCFESEGGKKSLGGGG